MKLIALFAVAATLVLSGCSKGDDTTTTTPPATNAVPPKP